MRNLGGAIGIAVSATMLNDRLNLHYLRLSENVTIGRPVIDDLLSRSSAHLSSVAGDALNASQAGLASLHALVMREALVLTFADCFYVLALCFLFGLMTVMFAKPITSAPPSSDAH
jgi:DHA2 family multidrug resistance protein